MISLRSERCSRTQRPGRRCTVCSNVTLTRIAVYTKIWHGESLKQATQLEGVNRRPKRVMEYTPTRFRRNKSNQNCDKIVFTCHSLTRDRTHPRTSLGPMFDTPSEGGELVSIAPTSEHFQLR